ncbi:hypothetical protein GSI_11612 [Ganoderma sinense ZZ0214-1]|uniref:Uncharacterized protein n=1 Tax=Ganoderma sinense ZZ0214-1 TaxID=1077348 RepID=A0A2G8RWG6_9APHY|nr:hypothetical protein GSI_11612 [Ganoderma sinense ZZ0214-1]
MESTSEINEVGGDNIESRASDNFCPNPTLTIDPFNHYGNRYVDISAGGPSPFTWAATSDHSRAKISLSGGSISPSAPEQRVFLSVDWRKVAEVQSAKIIFKATVPGQKSMQSSVTLQANHTAVSSGFHGELSIPPVIQTVQRVLRFGDPPTY